MFTHFLRKLTISFIILYGTTCTSYAANEISNDIEVGLIKASAGEKVSGFIKVPILLDDATQIPVTVINGAKTGPTLVLIAGTHGYEYAPIMALQHIAQTIDPMVVSGKIIIVHIANMPAFLGRNIYTNPTDGKNLNRTYPGRADGTQSERISHAITSQIIEQADYLIDMHSGDGNELLRPYIYMPHTGDKPLDAKIKDMALSFGIDHIVIDRAKITAPDKSVFTDMTALTRGIPAMTTEMGGAGSLAPKWVNGNVTGVMNLLRHLKMIEGDNPAPTPPVWLEDYAVVNSPATGIFKPSVRDGYVVAKGGLLGELVDLFGNHITTITAPFDGVINYVIITPPINKGEPLVMLSKIAK